MSRLARPSPRYFANQEHAPVLGVDDATRIRLAIHHGVQEVDEALLRQVVGGELAGLGTLQEPKVRGDAQQPGADTFAGAVAPATVSFDTGHASQSVEIRQDILGAQAKGTGSEHRFLRSVSP